MKQQIICYCSYNLHPFKDYFQYYACWYFIELKTSYNSIKIHFLNKVQAYYSNQIKASFVEF